MGGWNKEEVKHLCAETSAELNLLSRSKYVQSNCMGIYNFVKQKLINGESVLFSGTPCQINALNAYLEKKLKKNLYLVELVCHGVPSPKIWNCFVKTLCQRLNQPTDGIKSIKFKYKDGEKYFWNHPGFSVEWMNGTHYLEFSNCTWYENGFLGNLYVRPSCHECHFKSLSTAADITIGDFWGCEHYYPEFYDPDGVSVVSVNTKKGNELFSFAKTQLNLIAITKDEAVKYNSRFIQSSEASKNRKEFWKKYNALCSVGKENYEDLELLVNHCVQIPWYENKIMKMRAILGKVKSEFLHKAE